MNEGPERIDYRETDDVTEVHAAIQREHGDPKANVTPIPLWLTAVCGVAVLWAGAYLGVFHGGFSSNIYNEYESSPAALFPLPAKAGGKSEAAATLTLAQQGKAVYANCVTCHQQNGLGVPGQFPPLVKSEFALGGEKRLIAILLKGLQGPVHVEGQIFNGVMPPWEKNLSDKKIAAVLSFIRSEWGNAAPEVTEADVTSAKKEFENQTASWTEAQLLQIPADANYEQADAAPSAAPAAKPATPAPAAAAAETPAPLIAGTPAQGAPMPAAMPAPASADPAQLAQGKQVYMTVCFACHQPTGLGLPMVFPPLVKSEYANGPEERFAAMILKGNAGPMTVEGKPFNNVMPGQEAMLTDDKIAAVMTYVRANFGNSAPPVSPAVVAAARAKFADRKTPWTEPELKAFGGAAPAPEAAVPATPAPAAPTIPPAVATPEAALAPMPVPAPVPRAPAPAQSEPPPPPIAPPAPASQPPPTAPPAIPAPAPAAPEPAAPAPAQ